MNKATSSKMSFLVFGIGAIGTYVGGSLALAGHKVVFIERPEIAEAVRLGGLQLGIGGVKQTLANVEVVTSVSEALALRRYDAAILAVKSYDTSSVIESIQPVAEFFPPILCLQNGVENEIALRTILGAGNVIPGTVTTAVGRGAVGQIVVEKLRGTGIATTHPIVPDLINHFNEAGLCASGYAQADGMKWSKMLTNLLANASSAILDYSPAMIFAHIGLYRAEIAMLKEALAVMEALGYPVIDLPSTPVRALVGLVKTLPTWLSRPLLFQALGKGRGGKMPSFHIDLYAGRGKSEVDFLNGAVARFGQQVGVDTPINSWLTRVLLKLSSGELPRYTMAHDADKFLEWMANNRT